MQESVNALAEKYNGTKPSGQTWAKRGPIVHAGPQAKTMQEFVNMPLQRSTMALSQAAKRGPNVHAGPQAKAMQESIDTLAEKYNGTKVPVHITLMGGIVDDVEGARDRAKLLSGQLKVPLTLPFKAPFQCTIASPI